MKGNSDSLATSQIQKVGWKDNAATPPSFNAGEDYGLDALGGFFACHVVTNSTLFLLQDQGAKETAGKHVSPPKRKICLRIRY
jgi:hypothetical protein